MITLGHLGHPTKQGSHNPYFSPVETTLQKGRAHGLKTTHKSQVPGKVSLSVRYPQDSRWDPGFKRLTCMMSVLFI